MTQRNLVLYCASWKHLQIFFLEYSWPEWFGTSQLHKANLWLLRDRCALRSNMPRRTSCQFFASRQLLWPMFGPPQGPFGYSQRLHTQTVWPFMYEDTRRNPRYGISPPNQPPKHDYKTVWHPRSTSTSFRTSWEFDLQTSPNIICCL